MPLLAHLVELRKRVLIAVAGLLVGMIVAAIITNPVMAFLTRPMDQLDTVVAAELMITTITGGFDLRMRMAASIGILISAPVWLWQLWAFVMPGLTRKELRYTIGFVAAAVPLFIAGGLTALWVSPNVITMMSGIIPETTVNFFEAKAYYDFILKFVLAIGVGFVIPVFIVALNIAGVISGKDIIKKWRAAVLIATLFAAVTTPAMDAFSMLLLAGILTALYFAAALLSLLLDRIKRKKNPDSFVGVV